ncbi:hypothetical protein E2F46_04945 [Luteimonas aestuarii]|uniref:Lysozyme n=1 Tax=Luteimonas aestuarii TaxID=453837 RepID=A0A4R5TXM8_9GAMM|nr:hypothetical protein [Luteimonas aestuarii]TDK25957.1 hypothetical protein E2F46_04945 [Luteimonas aestuarii]
MDYRELDQQEYDRKLRMVIVGTEGLHPHVQNVGDNRATIGWGYTLNRNNNVEIWRNSGIELTDQQWATLRRVDAELTNAGKTRVGLTFTRELDEAEADRLYRASVREYEGPAIAADMPMSDERIAMVSVTYNRGIGAMQNHPINDAIADGDRAESWYQMRYNCWGSRQDMEGGLRKRRFAESEAFGLYDDRNNVSVEEAANVYSMYRSNRTEIHRVEGRFGVTIDGVEARPNRVAHANRDYPAIVDEYGPVRTLSESLEPARTVLLEHLRTRYPEQADDFTVERFDSGLIDLNRHPVQENPDQEREQHQPHPQHHAPFPEGYPPDHQGMNHPPPGPFNDPTLDRYYAAVIAGDSDLADRLAIEFANSQEGREMARMGDELFAQQQMQEQRQLEERQMAQAPQGPAMMR